MEGAAKTKSVFSHFVFYFFRGTGNDGSHAGRSFKKDTGLSFNDVKITSFVQGCVMDVEQLDDFAFGNSVYGAGNNFANAQILSADH